MTIELAMAASICALGLFQLTMTAIEYRRVHGVAYANTARDAGSSRSDSKLLGRLSRAQANLMETAPYFLALAVIISVAQISSELTRGAALAFVAARLIYFPLYAFGIPYLRGFVWTISFGALIVMTYAALNAADWNSILSTAM